MSQEKSTSFAVDCNFVNFVMLSDLLIFGRNVPKVYWYKMILSVVTLPTFVSALRGKMKSAHLMRVCVVQ